MKTSYPKMRAILSAALTLALLAGIPTAALAEGEGSVLPPPAVEEGAPLPETDGQIPAGQAEVPETLPEDGGLFPAPEIMEPETGELFPAEPEIAVPPTEEPLADVTAPEQTYDADPAADTAGLLGTEWDDPLYHKRMEQAGQISTASLTSDSFGRFTPRTLNANEALRRGVDVSGYQMSVDWTKAKQSGVEFAIVRTSYRGSTTGALCTDSWYKQNLSGAHAAGVKVGAYIFSQATTVEEAREEARFLIDTVKGYTIDLPLVFDYEETGNSDRRLKMSKLSRQTKIDICNAFCQEVEQAGYQSMIYSNPSTISSHLDRSQIKRLWLAHYTTKTDYSGPYEYWQCGYGNVEGVPGTVDLDFWFEPNGVSVPPLNEEQVSPTASPTPAPSATPAPTPTPASTPVPGASPTPSPEPETPAATPPAATPPAVVPPQNVVNPFKDVSAGKWYYNSVLWAYGKGIVNGLSSTSFGPNATATRGQLVAMLYRMQGQPAVTGASGFTDLVEDYYRDAVTWASYNGIVSGFTQTLFGPNNKVTREQLAAMLYRMAGSPAVTGDLSQFTDAGSVHSYSVSALIWAVGKGVVTGYDDGTIKPTEPATRAEVCTMMGRFAALG